MVYNYAEHTKKRTRHVSRLLELTVRRIYEMSTYILGVDELRGGMHIYIILISVRTV